MAIAVSPSIAGLAVEQPTRRLWTVAEFERFIDLGAFGPEEKLELVNGEIVTKVTQKAPHATATYKTQVALMRVFGLGYMVRSQAPLNLGNASGNRPEPDISVVEGQPEDFAIANPTTAVLVVEISDTSLAYDRTTKMGVYAQAGIPEYWVVNLTDRLLEVYRQPAPMTDEPSGHGYRSITRYTEDQTVAPLAVSDILP